jgi:putative FmdB family regulatory protein
MPIYEYRCKSCGFEKEYLQKLSDAPISQCPNCGKSEMVKLVTAAGFQLKGSGWYATDFKGGPKPAAKGDEAESKDKKDTKDTKEQPKAEQPKPDQTKSDQSVADKPTSGSSPAAPAAGSAAGS